MAKLWPQPIPPCATASDTDEPQPQPGLSVATTIVNPAHARCTDWRAGDWDQHLTNNLTFFVASPRAARSGHLHPGCRYIATPTNIIQRGETGRW